MTLSRGLCTVVLFTGVVSLAGACGPVDDLCDVFDTEVCTDTQVTADADEPGDPEVAEVPDTCETDDDCDDGAICEERAEPRCVVPANEGEVCESYFYDCEEVGCAYTNRTPCRAGLFCDRSTEEEWSGQFYCRQGCSVDVDCGDDRVCAIISGFEEAACVVPASLGRQCASEATFNSDNGSLVVGPCDRDALCRPESHTCALRCDTDADCPDAASCLDSVCAE